jgi:hypothetical protein
MARTAQELTAATNQFFSDPQVQGLLQQWRDFHARTGVWSDRRGPSSWETAIFQRLKASGIKDVRIDFSGPEGSPVLTNRGLEGWMYPLIIGGAAFGGAAALGAFGGAGAAAGGAGAAGGGAGGAGAGTAGGVLPATSLATGSSAVGGLGFGGAGATGGATGAFGGVGALGGAGGTAAGTGTAAGGSGWILPALGTAQVGAQLVGGYFQSKAAKTAAEQQAQAADKALALQREMYQTTREDLAPYRAAGPVGMTALSALLGLPYAPPPATAPAPSAAAPLAPLPGRAPGPGSTPVPGHAVPRVATVQMRAPTGQVQAVPADQVSFYEARGAQRI